jgi:hypothetical protein
LISGSLIGTVSFVCDKQDETFTTGQDAEAKSEQAVGSVGEETFEGCEDREERYGLCDWDEDGE